MLKIWKNNEKKAFCNSQAQTQLVHGTSKNPGFCVPDPISRKRRVEEKVKDL